MDAAVPKPQRSRREPAPTTPDPIEIAMEAEAHDTSPDSPARRLLEEQTRLVRTQRRSEAVGGWLKVLTGVGVLFLASVLGFMVWQASQARGIVIESFSVPPDLAAKGLTGDVIARRFRDQMAISADVVAPRPRAEYSNDWGGGAQVEIPQTGISVGELQRFLRDWLGHQRRVSGEVFQADDGLRLSLRATGLPGDTVGGGADLDSLLEKASFALMARTEPYRYGYVLSGQRDEAGARKVFERLVLRGNVDDQAWARVALAERAATSEEAAEHLTAAQALRPNLAAIYTLRNAENRFLGRTEAALADIRRVQKLMASRDRGGMAPESARLTGHQFAAMLGGLMGDFQTELREWPLGQQRGDLLTTNLARTRMWMHDLTGARATLFSDQDAVVARRIFQSSVTIALPNTWIARGAEDWQNVHDQALSVEAMLREPNPDATPNEKRARAAARTVVWPYRAEALANLGRIAEARALIGQTPLDCYTCLRMRGRVEALAGDPAGADRWYAEAVRQGPSLPQGHMEWGRARMLRGDLKGAIEKFAEAAKRGPRYGDPLVYWGEALLAQGDIGAAIVKFEQAGRLVPKWGRLHLKWGEALAKTGKTVEARAKWRAASGMDLTVAERAELARLQGAK